MRYLVASDLHYTLPHLDWIAAQASEFDAVVLAGDLVDAGGAVDVNAQIALLTAYLRKLGQRTAVIVDSGNHDLNARRPDGEKAALWMADIGEGVCVDGQAARVGGDVVSACAWWEGDATRGELEAQLDHDAALPRTGAWIWVYHSPPDASPTSWSGKQYYGDEVLNRLIERHRPDLVLTGHVHDAPYRPDGSWCDVLGGTTVLNAGRQIGPVPSHIVVDSEARTADWWSFEEQGSVGF